MGDQCGMAFALLCCAALCFAVQGTCQHIESISVMHILLRSSQSHGLRLNQMLQKYCMLVIRPSSQSPTTHPGDKTAFACQTFPNAIISNVIWPSPLLE
jgi:hypothetical protein